MEGESVMHFADIEKAFDSVHRESLWYVMRSYEISDRHIRRV